MSFDLNSFRKITDAIERKYPAFFETVRNDSPDISIHHFYYVYFNSRGHYLRFTANSGLPDFIKEEIKTAYQDYARAIENAR